MDNIAGYLIIDHSRCDKLYGEAQNCVSTEAWDRAETVFQQFCEALERHFEMEEKVLFAAFEKAIHSTDGPTCAMRDEHQKIRSIISMLQDALARRSRNAFLGHSDTLDIMIQQHNLVEDSILYPMIDRILSGQKDDIIKAMNKIGAAT